MKSWVLIDSFNDHTKRFHNVPELFENQFEAFGGRFY